MAGSQLKRLKSTLREQGIVGPQKSKKQKKRDAEEARANGRQDKRLRRSEALSNIREQFNPFQFKMSARGPKFPVTSIKSEKEGLRGIQGRPAVSLSKGEELRRNTLLVDMQRRNKVGGILDRRFGEGDETMTEEERALERFAAEKQKRIRKNKGSLFDLEDNGDAGLTHMGESLPFDRNNNDDDDFVDADGQLRDDFDEDDLPNSDDDDDDNDGENQSEKKKMLKRLREQVFGDKEGEEEEGAPGRKKTKKEVMEEVIAKSKYYKYERQVAKEDADNVRANLNNSLQELDMVMFGTTTSSARPKAGKGPEDKGYAAATNTVLYTSKAQPTSRTKTDEEKAKEQEEHMKKLEESRLKRMNGEIEYDSDDSDNSDDKKDTAANAQEDDRGFSFPLQEPKDEFGLGPGIKVRHTVADDMGFDDEDDFLIEDDLVASGEEEDLDLEEDPGDEDFDEDSDDDDNEFKKLAMDANGADFVKSMSLLDKTKGTAAPGTDAAGQVEGDASIPSEFSTCPQTHAELLEVMRGIPVEKQSIVVLRLRRQYHARLAEGNKDRLGQLGAVLVEHVAYLADGVAAAKNADADANKRTYQAIEMLIRHTHTLALATPIPVATAFRAHLNRIRSTSGRDVALTNGDLIVLTAVTMFSTSDHFHQVVTPSMLTMARFLEYKNPETLADHATGLYVCTLFLQYQQLSKRYVPELVNFAVNTLLSLAPVAPTEQTREAIKSRFPLRTPPGGMRTRGAEKATVCKLKLTDCVGKEQEAGNDLKVSILSTAVSVLSSAMSLWTGRAALYETLEPVRSAVQHLRSTKACRSQLPSPVNDEIDRLGKAIDTVMQIAKLSRRPLELHHHRPLAIPTFVPRFEEDYDPDKHYDPNQERSEAAKLQAEYKRERKGVLREIRKDAHFMQREKLKVKRAKDAAYEKKYKRLVSEIQGQEGAEANAYERERQARKRAKH